MRNTIQRAFCWNWANHSGKLCNANGIKAMNHILISQGQKKEHLNRMREIQFREASAYTKRIKYNTNGIKIVSSKNIDLLKVKRRHSWIQWSNKIQQHFCWSPVNHSYNCAKRKIIASKHEKQSQTSRNIGQYVYYKCLLTRFVNVC